MSGSSDDGSPAAELVTATLSYDGLNRRIVKAVTNSGDWDCTYHSYYSGQNVVEERNGSQQTLKQYVWGLSYVDELVQIGVNQDPGDSHEHHCERFFWVCQDANFNVQGVVDANGRLVERYEYTPYGQRTIFSHPWLLEDANDNGSVGLDDDAFWFNNLDGDADSRADFNGNGQVDLADESWVYNALGATDCGDADPLVTIPTFESTRGYSASAGSAVTPSGLCDFGHQGLLHDKEFGLIYNRARYLSPTLGRFLQRDPLGYIDGMSMYQYCRSNCLSGRDPSGLQVPIGEPVDQMPGEGLRVIMPTVEAAAVVVAANPEVAVAVGAVVVIVVPAAAITKPLADWAAAQNARIAAEKDLAFLETNRKVQFERLNHPLPGQPPTSYDDDVFGCQNADILWGMKVQELQAAAEAKRQAAALATERAKEALKALAASKANHQVGVQTQKPRTKGENPPPGSGSGKEASAPKKPVYKANAKHNPIWKIPDASAEPVDAGSVFENAVPDPEKPGTWWGENSEGDIYRFFGNDKEAHFAGSARGNPPIPRDDIPVKIRRSFDFKK